jgi:hypothetical protein
MIVDQAASNAGSSPTASIGIVRLRLPTLLDRDGKAADQSCGFLEGPTVLVLEEGGEPLNTLIVAVDNRYVIELSSNR